MNIFAISHLFVIYFPVRILSFFHSCSNIFFLFQDVKNLKMMNFAMFYVTPALLAIGAYFYFQSIDNSLLISDLKPLLRISGECLTFFIIRLMDYVYFLPENIKTDVVTMVLQLIMSGLLLHVFSLLLYDFYLLILNFKFIENKHKFAQYFGIIL